VNLRARLVPHAATSGLLFIGWLLLQRSLSPGNLLLAAVLALGLPLFTQRFWPQRVPIGRPLTLLRFIVVVLWDIAVANFNVALLVLGPRRAIQPGFVRLALDLDSDFAITLLLNTVSLTPGTVSAELSPDGRHLTIHYLSCDDEAALVETVKRRYEAPIREIFEC
jgi:multicomponent K+:H+ antiporter subunit E